MLYSIQHLAGFHSTSADYTVVSLSYSFSLLHGIPLCGSEPSVLLAWVSRCFPIHCHYKISHYKYIFLFLSKISKDIFGLSLEVGYLGPRANVYVASLDGVHFHSYKEFMREPHSSQPCLFSLVWNLKHFYNLLGEKIES